MKHELSVRGGGGKHTPARLHTSPLCLTCQLGKDHTWGHMQKVVVITMNCYHGSNNCTWSHHTSYSPSNAITGLMTQCPWRHCTNGHCCHLVLSFHIFRPSYGNGLARETVVTAAMRGWNGVVCKAADYDNEKKKKGVYSKEKRDQLYPKPPKIYSMSSWISIWKERQEFKGWESSNKWLR